MTLQPIGIDDLAGAASVSLVEVLPDETYSRIAPLLLNASIVDPADLSHLERVFRDSKQTVSGMRLYEIHNAVILRLGELIVDEHYLVAESVLHSRPAGPATGAMLETTAKRLAEQLEGGRDERYEFGLLLNQWSYRNYGHFLVEILPKVVFAQANFDLSEAALMVNRGTTGAVANVYQESFHSLGLAQPLTPVRARARVDHALFATTAGTHGINKCPHAVRQVRELFLPGKPEPWGAANGRRLWIQRKDEYKRRLINQAELMEVAAAFGFEPVTPEAMTVAEQAALFSEASACIGPIGAAFTNILFCRPGTRVLTLSPNHGRETFFYDLACITGVTYAYLFGEVADPSLRFNSDFSGDTKTLRQALEQIFSQ